MDFSFTLAVARMRGRGAPIVSTSYLQRHDPREVEVYPSDDGDRATYRRRSLPSMGGALQRNLREVLGHGVEVRYGVDATDLGGTLRPQKIVGGFREVLGHGVE